MGGRLGFIDETKQSVNNIRNCSPGVDVGRFYIPTLRGMRRLSDEDDPYVLRTAKDYFKGSNFGLITGHNLYSEMAKYLLGTPEMRDQIKMYEAKIGEYFFEGRKVAIIPRYGEDVVYVKIGDDDEFPIYQLGDGLQQLIILTYKAYLEKEPAIFFVEEPEVHLHAGMLRKLMYFWDRETSWHQFFITTHSNHLLSIEELRDSVSVFKFNKIDGKCNISQVDKDRSLLNDLGVQASSVYLANCTIWVEGITDRRYLQTYMRRYLRDLKASEADGDKPSVYHRFVENYHYSFVEYQGGGLAHWDFGTDDEEQLQADVVSAEIFLMADQDIKSKGDRFVRLQESLGDRLYTTPGKEIENLLPDTIVNETVKSLFKSKKVHTKGGLSDATVAGICVQYKNYYKSMTGLGHHIDCALGLAGKGQVTKNRPGPHVFSDQSGTVKDKVRFCEEACKLMDASDENWELPQPVKELCEKIFAHIARHND